jgi:hypothetical protein
MTSIWRLIYTSRRTCIDVASAPDEVAAIQQVATINNGRADLAGALVASPRRFAQVLEGTRDALEETFERISRDPRHDDLLVMSFAPTDARAFGDFRLVAINVADPGEVDAESAGEAMLAQLRTSMDRLDIAAAFSAA